MIFDQSLSFKGGELDTMFSICPSSPQMEQRTISDQQELRMNSGEEFLEKKSRCTTTSRSVSVFRNERNEAALKLQKVYKSFRTRRQLADCAVLAEQRWWKLLDFAELKRSSISFFDIEKPETAISRWARARTRAAKVGKGSSKAAKARKLALQHWLEAIDPRHRYGHNLQFYYIRWLHCESKQPFFYWLDVGEGRDVTLERCPRPRLQQQCIKYLGPMERKAYEVMVENGKFFYRESGKLLDTSGGPKDAKWIFVLSTSKTLYVGMKNKGTFQHSSFLAGGATLSAGRLVVKDGTLKAVWPHSGHYLPTEENFQELMSFLAENKVDLSKVKKCQSDEEEAAVSKQSEAAAVSKQSVADSSRSSEPTDGQELVISSKSGNKNIDATENSNLPSLWCELMGSKMSKLKIPKSDCSIDMSNVKSPHEQSRRAESPDSQSEDGYETAEESFSDQDSIIAKSNLFDNEQEEYDEEPIPREKILQRIESHKGLRPYQLAQHLSCRWTTGAGPRIGCMRDYPSELQVRVLEETNMSPRATKVSPSRRAMSRFSSKPFTSACREETADRSPLTPEKLMLYQTATP